MGIQVGWESTDRLFVRVRGRESLVEASLEDVVVVVVVKVVADDAPIVVAAEAEAERPDEKRLCFSSEEAASSLGLTSWSLGLASRRLGLVSLLAFSLSEDGLFLSSDARLW